VLVFVWGAFAFIRKVSGVRPDWWLIAIIMLAYGWVFHMGFFNYYISLGLCFWALSLAWDFRPSGLGAAAALFALAYVAHGLALAWAVGVLAYHFLIIRVLPGRRMLVFLSAIGEVEALAFIIGSMWKSRWFDNQFSSCIGVDQVVPYADRYWWVSTVLALAIAVAIVFVIQSRGGRATLSGKPVQVCILTAIGIAVIPNWIAIPNYNHALVFLAQRTSLALAVVMCSIAASAPKQRASRYALIAAGLMYFGYLYRDEAALNGFEDQIAAAVAQLPPNQRVLTAVEAPNVRSNPLAHMLDRECIDRCYSYGNYEPSSAQFRVRIDGASPIVVPTDKDSNNLQAGTYLVQPRDVPVYQILARDDGQVVVRQLSPGMMSGMTVWKGL
jgi:hypothetical protein